MRRHIPLWIRELFGLLCHRVGWGCGIMPMPDGNVSITCVFCIREMVEPKIVATPCHTCGHILYHHASSCNYCDCAGWVKPPPDEPHQPH